MLTLNSRKKTLESSKLTKKVVGVYCNLQKSLKVRVQGHKVLHNAQTKQSACEKSSYNLQTWNTGGALRAPSAVNILKQKLEFKVTTLTYHISYASSIGLRRKCE